MVDTGNTLRKVLKHVGLEDTTQTVDPQRRRSFGFMLVTDQNGNNGVCD